MHRNPNVGRVAQLTGLVSKAQLNEAYVVVESFNPTSDRLAIRTLPTPINPVEAESFAVKLSNLRFPASVRLEVFTRVNSIRYVFDQ